MITKKDNTGQDTKKNIPDDNGAGRINFLSHGELNKQYYLPLPGRLHVQQSLNWAAINKNEWLRLCEHDDGVKLVWLTTSLPLGISLLFSFVCLLATATLTDNGNIRWSSVVCIATHGAGSVMFFILSFYFWYQLKRSKKEKSYIRLRKKFDRIFKI
ncbi:MAG: hypothetical protein ACYSYT_00960 [Planctomycetota bacterium]|jgi:hypothetical protein